MSKPGFVKERIIQLFESNDVEAQQKIVDNYNNLLKVNIKQFKKLILPQLYEKFIIKKLL